MAHSPCRRVGRQKVGPDGKTIGANKVEGLAMGAGALVPAPFVVLTDNPGASLASPWQGRGWGNLKLMAAYVIPCSTNAPLNVSLPCPEGSDTPPAAAIRSRADTSVTDEVIPHFHNARRTRHRDRRQEIPVCRRAATTGPSACLLRHGRRDRVCVPLLRDVFRHNPALAPNEARPPECEFHDGII